MFVVCRKLKGKEKFCILICQSVREDKKVTQKTIKYYGIAHNKEEKDILVGQAKKEILKLTGKHKQEAKVSEPCEGALLGHMEERFRKTEGFHDILGPIFDELNIAPLFSKIRYEQLKDVVIARIAQPASKLRTANILQKNFLRPLSEDQIYHLMDEIISCEDLIKLKVFEMTQKLSEKESIEFLFFDVTTLYFESQKSDELREFGYSKDHKVGETQVVLALATTVLGDPIGYQLFKGNKAEVSTLMECLNQWKKLFNIKTVTVVADRAMMSENNLTSMEKSDFNFSYIVAAKLKKLPKKLREEILKRTKETEAYFGEEEIFIQEHLHDGRRIIVQYSKNRAEKDFKDRERLLEKIRKKLDSYNKTGTRKLVTNNGYLKFLDEETKGKAVLNEQKIIEEQLWDGLHGIITNDKGTSALELLKRYRGLWVIEESFRINKHTLSMRPIYHYNTERIRAHVLICYLAFATIRYTQKKINLFDKSISIQVLIDTLSQVESTILEDVTTGNFYKIPSNMEKEAKTIYRAMGIKRSSSPSIYSEQLKNVV